MSTALINVCQGMCCKSFSVGRSQWGEMSDDTVAHLTLILRPAAKPDHFTCALWDANTKRCTNYIQRPDMCATFPYGKPCGFGCSYKQWPREARTERTLLWLAWHWKYAS